MSRSPVVLGVVLATLTCAACVVSAVGLTSGSAAPAPPARITAAKAPAGPALIEPVEIPAAEAPAGPPAGPPAVELLHAWDGARAAAWARGDPRLLVPLYTPGSVAGRRDRAMLRAWSRRGLVARGLRTQLVAVRELRRGRSTWTLLVTDRLVGGTAVGRGRRLPLPRDRVSTRTVRLRLVGGRWRVAAVTP